MNYAVAVTAQGYKVIGRSEEIWDVCKIAVNEGKKFHSGAVIVRLGKSGKRMTNRTCSGYLAANPPF